jgi:nucleoside-diphosphate-sugar epimerase
LLKLNIEGVKVRIFLTGLSGYLGSYLAEFLSSCLDVEAITGISRTPPKSHLPEKVKFIPMDMRDPEIALIMKDHDVVLHTALLVFWTVQYSLAERDQINFDGIRNVALAARQAGVQRFIQCSSIAAYDYTSASGKEGITEDWPLGSGNLPLYYPNAKAVSERVLCEVFEHSNTCLTILRPPFIIGPHDHTYITSIRQNPMRYPGRDPRAQYIHEDDLGAVYLQAMHSELLGAYNVVPDDYLRWSEVLQIVGVRHAFPVPGWLARSVMDLRWRYYNSRLHPDWYYAQSFDWVFSNSKLRQTGWKPEYSSAHALRSALNPV